MAKKIICQHDNCEKFDLLQPEANFYISNYKLMRRLPICKKCIEENVDLTKLSELLGILQILNYPYFDKTWQLIVKDYPDAALSRYIAEIRRNPTTKKMGFADTEKLPEECTGLIEVDMVTDAMREKFGSNYSNEELLAMDKKYRFLQSSYDETTSMHTEAITSYVRYRVKEEMATERDDINSAKAWGALAEKSAVSAGITPQQLKKADLVGGITTFGELTQIIEENADGVIPVLPRYRPRPDDSIDMNIFMYINYARHLEGKELCSYEDVYKFYDKRRDEYVKKTGDPYDIFKNDPTRKNRERVAEFLDIPEPD